VYHDLQKGFTMTDNKPESPIQPLELSIQDTIQFRCHPEISCFNQCCQHIDILLTPYDIIRLKNHFNLSSEAFLAQYTYPFEMDEHVPYQVHDLISGAYFLWNGEYNYVEIDPGVMPVHIFKVRRKVRSERDFDYFM